MQETQHTEFKREWRDEWLKKHGMHWDTVTVPRLGLESLSSEAIGRLKRMAVHSTRLAEDALVYTDQELLEKLLLLENGELKRAAVLLFHAEPERFISNAFVKVGLFVDEHANLLHFDKIRGSLFEQVFNTIEVMKLKYMKAMISYDGLLRRETFPVPLEALREAVLNAVVHKDYATAAPIQISVYPNRIMIWNPGYMPENWTMDTFLNKHSSRPFNPDIASTFFRSGLIETWGRGIERIQEACEAAGVPAPEWSVQGSDFWTTFYFAEGVDGVASGLVEGAESGAESLRARAATALLSGELSKSEIAAALGMSGVTGALNRSIRDLLNDEIIEYSIPDKPNSRLQKYRLTAKGKNLVN